MDTIYYLLNIYHTDCYKRSESGANVVSISRNKNKLIKEAFIHNIKEVKENNLLITSLHENITLTESMCTIINVKNLLNKIKQSKNHSDSESPDESEGTDGSEGTDRSDSSDECESVLEVLIKWAQSVTKDAEYKILDDFNNIFFETRWLNAEFGLQRSFDLFFYESIPLTD